MLTRAPEISMPVDLAVVMTALVDALPDAAWLVDRAGLRILAANRTAEQLFGLDRQVWIGVAVRDLFATPEDHAFWDEVAAGGEPQIASETLITSQSGQAVPVLRQVAP